MMPGFNIEPVTASQAHSGQIVFGAVSGVGGANRENKYLQYAVLAVVAVVLIRMVRRGK